MFKNKVSDFDTEPISRISKLKFISIFIKRIGLKRWLFLALIILAVGGTFASVYYYRQYQALKVNPNLEAQKETASLVMVVGKLMELPGDETPTVATIQDKDKLKDQSFFAKAENGDKLLAYTKAMQAILYRPSINKIINVAPIVINQPESVSQNAPATQAPVATPSPAGLKIAYYNGTEVVGLSGQAEKAVKASYPGSQTGALTNAKKKDYKETLVIDITGIHNKEVEDIASLLGGKVSPLPVGENRPDADILIISGK